MAQATFRICPEDPRVENWNYADLGAVGNGQDANIPFIERYLDNSDQERGIFRPLVQGSVLNPPPLYDGGNLWSADGEANYINKMGPDASPMRDAYSNMDWNLARQERNKVASFRDIQRASIQLEKVVFRSNGYVDVSWRFTRPSGIILFANDHPAMGLSARALERSLCLVTEVLLQGGKKVRKDGELQNITREDMTAPWYVQIVGRTASFDEWQEVDFTEFPFQSSYTSRLVTNPFRIHVATSVPDAVVGDEQSRPFFEAENVPQDPLAPFGAVTSSMRNSALNWFGIDRLMWSVAENYRPRGAPQERADFSSAAQRQAMQNGELEDEYEWLFAYERTGVYVSEMTVRIKCPLWEELRPMQTEEYQRAGGVGSRLQDFVSKYYPAVTPATFLGKDIYKTIAEYVTRNNVRLPLRRVLLYLRNDVKVYERLLSMAGAVPGAQAGSSSGGPVRRGRRELANIATSSSFVASIVGTSRRPRRGQGVGGCWKGQGRNSRGGKYEILPCGWMVWSPCVKFNNCLIACFFKAFESEVKEKKWKIQDVKKTQLRRTPSEMCDFDDVEILEELFACTVVVYNELRQVIYGRVKDLQVGKRNVELLLMEQHYYLIKLHEPWEHECDECGSVVKDLLKHKCNQVNKEKIIRYAVEQTEIIRKASSVSDTVKETQSAALLNRTVFYDFETVHLDQKFQVYAVGMYVTWTGQYQAFYGQGCVKDFLVALDELEKSMQEIVSSKTPLYLISFNGSGFDHFMIMEECLRSNRSISSFLMARGRLLQLSFGKWKTVDMYLFVGPSSLSKVCQAFKVPVQKDIFPHLYPKTWDDVVYVGPYLDIKYYPSSMQEDYRKQQETLDVNAVFSFKDECLKYLEKDVMCLFHLTNLFTTSMMEVTGLNVMEYITLSQLSFEYWRQMLPDPIYEPRHLHFQMESSPFFVPKHKRPLPINAIYLPKDLTQYEFIQRAIYGGRTHPVKMCFVSKDKDKPFEEIEDYLIDGDVRSLYPTAMSNPFPVGKPYWVGEEDASRFQKQLEDTQRLPFSIWEVKVIPNKSLIVPALPKKVPLSSSAVHEKKLMTVWDVTDSDFQVYTSVDLEQGSWYGYRFEFRKGLVWPTSDSVFSAYINRVFEIKNDEDLKDKAKDPSYNPARRNIAKLQMNALYGKMLQKVVKQDFRLDKVMQFSDFEKFMHRHEHVKVHDLPNEWTLLEGTKKDVVPLMKKPNHLGAFVLAFSRRVMNQYFDALDPYRRQCEEGLDKADVAQKSMEESFYYTDTDSMFFHSSQFERNMKQYFVDGLGKLDDELRGAKIIEAYFLAPKLYALKYKDANDKEGVKMRAKGIPANLLQFEHFQQMYHGQQAISYSFDMFKKHLFRLNEKEREKGYHEFSVSLHEGQQRKINQQPSKARIILQGRQWTIPHGFDQDILDVWELAGVEDMYQTTSEDINAYGEWM